MGVSSKTGERQGAHTLQQPCGVAITLFGFTDHTTSKYTAREGVLSYLGYTGICRWTGYGFLASLS